MKKIELVVILLFLVTLFGCSEPKSDDTTMVISEIDESGDANTIEENKVDWKDTVIKDISSGSEFKMSDFKGKLILVESFAVWCPTCKKQQDEIKKFHEVVGDSVVSVSLDTDPNEDESQVKAHIDTHGYGWYYAVSPKSLTQSLIDEFGVTVVNAPQAPIILICEDFNSRLLGRGVKDSDELQAEIDKGC